MIRPGIAHPLCAILIALLAAPAGFSQTPAPQTPVAPASATAAPPASAPARPASSATPKPLTITVLEGKDSINSIQLLRSVGAVVEVQDSNDFPVEGATVVFSLPAQGPGGTFVLGGKTFSTRTDARGEATAPLVVPAGAGKFQITVMATEGDRKGEAVIYQTNTEGAYVGPPVPAKPWYTKKKYWIAAGVAVAAIVVVVVLTHKSKSTTVVITPGTPVFQ